jgi:hypothetical protein
VNERYSKDFLDGKYRPTKLASTYNFDKKSCSWFPRMYSREERHIQAYNSWIDIKGKKVSVNAPYDKQETINVPRLSDHIKYFVKYQLGYMFGRYFMWNFVGRQNDRQGRGDLLNGNWLSGLSFIDNVRIGPQSKLPDWMKNNKARNTYFFIPFVLGLIGAFFQYKIHKQTFFIVLALFLMGGLGLTVYINEVPITPRERDYVFVVAFMAFCIWTGMSCSAITTKITQFTKQDKLSLPIFVTLLLACPGLMAYQNFDDHDRSDRYAARDLAVNILNSCPHDAILFTSGDNDTYPLLYCQEVEGIRTDVRIVIMPFLAANWFIDGLCNPKYDAAGLQMILPQKKYDFGELDYIPVVNKTNRDTSWEEALTFLKSDNVNTKVQLNSGEIVNYLPLTKLNFQINTEDKTGEIAVSLKDKNFLYKHEIVLWDIISSNAPYRPLCFVSKAEAQKYGLNNNLRCDGFAYRLVPEKNESDNIFSIGNCNSEKMYQKLMNDFNWGNIADESVYTDWNTIVNLSVFQVQNIFNEVAQMLLQKGEKEKAKELLILSADKIPISKISYDIFTVRQVELMVKSGLEKKAIEIYFEIEKNIIQTLEFFASLSKTKRTNIATEIQKELYYLNVLVGILSEAGMEKKTDELRHKMEEFIKRLE